MPSNRVTAIGLPDGDIEHLRNLPEVAVLKCVDDRGEKLTAVGNATHLRELVASGVASDRDGMALGEPHWPVVVRDWLQAS